MKKTCISFDNVRLLIKNVRLLNKNVHFSVKNAHLLNKNVRFPNKNVHLFNKNMNILTENRRFPTKNMCLVNKNVRLLNANSLILHRNYLNSSFENFRCGMCGSARARANPFRMRSFVNLPTAMKMIKRLDLVSSQAFLCCVRDCFDGAFRSRAFGQRRRGAARVRSADQARRSLPANRFSGSLQQAVCIVVGAKFIVRTSLKRHIRCSTRQVNGEKFERLSLRVVARLNECRGDRLPVFAAPHG